MKSSVLFMQINSSQIEKNDQRNTERWSCWCGTFVKFHFLALMNPNLVVALKVRVGVPTSTFAIPFHTPTLPSSRTSELSIGQKFGL